VRTRKIDHKTQTCSGERGNDLFPMVNVICGMFAISLQSINVCPTGLGSFSHSFYRKKTKSLLVLNWKNRVIEHSIQK